MEIIDGVAERQPNSVGHVKWRRPFVVGREGTGWMDCRVSFSEQFFPSVNDRGKSNEPTCGGLLSVVQWLLISQRHG